MKMKYIIIFLFASIISSAQISKEQLNIMPWPQNITLSEGSFALTKNFKVNVTGAPDSRIFIGVTNFLRRLDGRTGLFFNQGFVTRINEAPDAELQINCVRAGKVELHEDESYLLNVTPNKITINATTDVGALHGLETLLQLLQNNSNSFYFPVSKISDFPRFTWRGLMIDGARHFMPVDVIKRNLDGMAAVKMNVFHWHLVDDQGWRIEMKKHPKLIEMASDGNYYTQEEIKGVVKYAADRGILVVPELDVPGHGTAILTAYPEIGSKSQSYSLERNAGIFTPTLDPSNPKTYELLSEFFDEICPLFPGKYFHIGGDENEGKDWDSNPKIQEFKKKHSLANNHELQTYFTMQLIPMLQKHNKVLMGWEEIMTKNMSKDAIIHSWKGGNEGLPAGKSLVDAAKGGYKTVLSNGFYIDLVYKLEDHYSVNPMPKNGGLTDEEKARILGGEAVMWSELASPATIDSRIWPRTAAIAERLWSDESVTDLNSVRRRLHTVSFRLEELGLTHIKSKEGLLRNISNNQKSDALLDFANICEPLKGYTRNQEGTEYKMYSPLTLFADICTPDAADALEFDVAVTNYLKNQTAENQNIVVNYLNKWIKMDGDLNVLSNNAPLVQPLLPLSKKLKDLSEQLLIKISKKQNINVSLINELLEKCNTKEHADVELAVYNSLKRLVQA
jgi:hexosaminidase